VCGLRNGHRVDCAWLWAWIDALARDLEGDKEIDTDSLACPGGDAMR
jgi:hypothetical protein